MKPRHIHDIQWAEALTIARQNCARIFRDGGTPADALAAFGIFHASAATLDWSDGVEVIAAYLCRRPEKMAA